MSDDIPSLDQGGVTRRNLLRTAGIGAGALMLPGVLAACGGGTSTTAGPATTSEGPAMSPLPSGTIDYLGFEGEDFKESKATQRWLKENGASISSTYWTSFVEGISSFPSGRAEGVDIVHVASCTLPMLLEVGNICEPLDQSKLPNMSRVLPEFQGPDQLWYHEGELMAVPLSLNPFAINWDSERVPQAPTSWTELADPQFKDRLMIYNDPLVLIWTITEILKLGPQGRLPKSAAKPAAEYLKRMVDNARALATSLGDVITAFSNEDIDACFCGSPVIALIANQSGAKNVQFNMEPTDGNTLSMEGLGLATTSDNVDSVYAVLNKGLEAVPNADFNNILGGAPTVEGAQAKLDPAIANAYPPGVAARLAKKFPYSIALPLESDEFLTDAEWRDQATAITGT